MRAPESIERSVIRAYTLSIAAIASAVVGCGAAAANWVVIDRDDAAADALGRTLGSELAEHAQESPAERSALVDHELAEQHWFSRTIEVWRGDQRIGGAGEAGTLRAWSGVEGCSSHALDAGWTRVCAVPVGDETTVVVASPLRPLLAAELPLVATIAVAAAAAALAAALVSRRLVRRSLAPLRRFEQRLGGLPPVGGVVGGGWGAREIDELARTFDVLSARTAEALAREQRFVANAAHEMRTPLTRLRGQIELARADDSARGEIADRLSRASRTIDELGTSIEALLAMAREQVSMEEAVDLADVVTRASDSAGPGAARRTVTGEAEALVRGDEALLVLAVKNLLENSFKYANDGAIEVRVDADPQRCAVTVADQGPGLAEEELSHVLLPFTRGRARPLDVRGSGLGLSLVAHVAALHGGKFRLENRTPRGLLATIELPTWRGR